MCAPKRFSLATTATAHVLIGSDAPDSGWCDMATTELMRGARLSEFAWRNSLELAYGAKSVR